MLTYQRRDRRDTFRDGMALLVGPAHHEIARDNSSKNPGSTLAGQDLYLENPGRNLRSRDAGSRCPGCHAWSQDFVNQDPGNRTYYRDTKITNPGFEGRDQDTKITNPGLEPQNQDSQSPNTGQNLRSREFEDGFAARIFIRQTMATSPPPALGGSAAKARPALRRWRGAVESAPR